jgi:hypothetical protein
MNSPKFNLGDAVWFAATGQRERVERCPDCCGTRVLLVTMGDGTQHSIACSLCGQGYEPSTGVVNRMEFFAEPQQGFVQGVEQEDETYKYKLDSCWRKDESDLFTSREDALTRSQFLVAQNASEEAARFQRKTKDGRTWAWHVRWHRDQLKKAERDAVYHRSKLEVAKSHVKAGLTEDTA